MDKLIARCVLCGGLLEREGALSCHWCHAQFYSGGRQNEELCVEQGQLDNAQRFLLMRIANLLESLVFREDDGE